MFKKMFIEQPKFYNDDAFDDDTNDKMEGLFRSALKKIADSKEIEFDVENFKKIIVTQIANYAHKVGSTLFDGHFFRSFQSLKFSQKSMVDLENDDPYIETKKLLREKLTINSETERNKIILCEDILTEMAGVTNLQELKTLIDNIKIKVEKEILAGRGTDRLTDRLKTIINQFENSIQLLTNNKLKGIAISLKQIIYKEKNTYKGLTQKSTVYEDILKDLENASEPRRRLRQARNNYNRIEFDSHNEQVITNNQDLINSVVITPDKQEEYDNKYLITVKTPDVIHYSHKGLQVLTEMERLENTIKKDYGSEAYDALGDSDAMKRVSSKLATPRIASDMLIAIEQKLEQYVLSVTEQEFAPVSLNQHFEL